MRFLEAGGGGGDGFGGVCPARERGVHDVGAGDE